MTLLCDYVWKSLMYKTDLLLARHLMSISCYLCGRKDFLLLISVYLAIKMLSRTPRWLRICLPMQGTGFNLQPGKIPHAKGQIISPCTTTTEPTNTKAHMPRVCTLQQETPPQWEAWALQLETEASACNNYRKPAHSNEDPVQPKISKLKNVKC